MKDDSQGGAPAPEAPELRPPREISDEEFERQRRRMRREELRYHAQLPDAMVAWWKFRSKVLGTPAHQHQAPSGHPMWDRAFCRLRGMIESRPERDTGLIIGLVGLHGSGKSVLGTGLLLGVTSRLESARYTTAFDLALELEAALQSAGEVPREAVVNDHRKPRLLVVDDCSAASGSESETRCLRAILDHRYYRNRDTVLISNETAEAFCERLGAGIVDRTHQRGGIIECNWQSFRQ